MYIEKSSCHIGNGAFFNFERPDVLQNIITTFYFNSNSILTNELIKSICRFRLQLLLEDSTWSTQ